MVHWRQFSTLHLGAATALLWSTGGVWTSILPVRPGSSHEKLENCNVQDQAGWGLSSPPTLPPLHICLLPALRSVGHKSRLTFWSGNPCNPHTQTGKENTMTTIQLYSVECYWIQFACYLTHSCLSIALSLCRDRDTLWVQKKILCRLPRAECINL